MPKRSSPKTSATVTQIDVGRACGVTGATVSMALRGDPRISARTREQVADAARRLGYDPAVHHAARRLSLRRHGARVTNRVIGVISPTSLVEAAYFRRLFAGAFRVLTDAGYAVLVADPTPRPGESPAATLERLAPLARGEIDGLFGLAEASLVDVLAQLRQRSGFGSCPVALVIRSCPGCASVVADETVGLWAAVRRLADLGHRQILCLNAGPAWAKGESAVQAARRQTVAEALAACVPAGAPVPLSYLVRDAHWMDPVAAEARLARVGQPDPQDRALLECLAAHPAVTAIVASNDAAAIHVYAALRDAGLGVPQRCSVVGFDDSDPVPGPDGKDLLSSVAIPFEAMGARAAQMLLHRLRGTAAGEETVTLPTEFRERASIGPAPV